MVRLLRFPIIIALLFVPAPAAALDTVLSSLRVAVVDPQGQPVAAALVLVRTTNGLTREARTGSSGTCTIDHLRLGTYSVMASVEGFRSDPAAIDVRSDAIAEVRLSLRVSAISEAIVVSAAYVDTPLSEAPGNVSVLSQVDLQARQLSTVAGALALVPGGTVAHTGGAGSLTSLFPRGGESDYTLVLVDGIRMNSFGGGFDFGHLSAFGMDRMEVVRGPQSAVFGADAIGGVISLRTRLGGNPTASAQVETGGYGTNRFATGTTSGRNALSWGAHVERVTSRGWTNLAPASSDRVANDDYAATTVAVSGGWAPAPHSTLRADARYMTNERGNPGPFGSNPIGIYSGIDLVSRGKNNNGMGSLSFTHEWTTRSALRVQSTYADLRSQFVSGFGESDARTRRWTAHAQVDHGATRALATSFGVDLNVERADSTYVTGSTGSRIPVNRLVAGYFGEARFKWSSRLFVTAGLRVEQIERRRLDADPFGFQPRPELGADRVMSANPRVAGSFYIRTSDRSGGNWSRLHATAGTGIRPPDAFEIAFTDNPGLKPERNQSADAGLEQALAGGRLIVDATAFVNHYNDLIVAVGGSLKGYSRYRTDNISNARARGLETSATLRTRGGLEARVTYTYLDTAVLAVDRSPDAAPPPFRVGDPLLRRPRHQAAVDLLWKRHRLTVFARAGGRSGVLDVEPSWGAFGGLYDNPGFAVADAGASFRLAHQIELLARVENLLDRQYESVFGYPAPRRTLSVGVRLAAGR
ncbi:MAG: TonB-dependent receptor [Acidobacteriota bacterium]